MRYRRAERCVLRAEAALDAGLEAEARAALEEARSLRSDVPSFDELIAAARARRVAAVAAKRREQIRRGMVAAACLLVLSVIGAAVYFDARVTEVQPHIAPVQTPQVAGTSSAPQTIPIVEPVPQGDGVAPTPPVGDQSPPLDSAAPAPRAEIETPGTRAAATRMEERAAAERPARATPLPEVSEAPDAPPVSPPPAPTTTETLIEPRVDPSLSPVALGTTIANSLPPPAPPPDPKPVKPSAPPEPESHEPAVRAVLARFEAAYSTLSASAARQVWPSVDERALGRAFESLESQQVSLGNCSVSIEASTAHAECRGSMTWTPKVGGGRRTEARRWEFDLARTNGTWEIVQARAR